MQASARPKPPLGLLPTPAQDMIRMPASIFVTMKSSRSLMIALPLGAVVVTGSIACAQIGRGDTAETARQTTGSRQRVAKT
jgi:hypothetical protein